ncbi:hypothetical protein ACFV1L_10395 [Kitasatospora sp. NPDC059646]|uniref:hypothetical protein n=1 Tax=Kitasatospora sp. NPDC059646 TaxID=3346893 RepID=UPI0036CDD772
MQRGDEEEEALMANVTTTCTATVELTGDELTLIQRALQLVRDFGGISDWDAAAKLLADLEVEP